ncbi:hypothetical protein JF535_00725 [Microbulbifer salipaludis]|uniref:Uncharacterized protein n=1 Tax=Microbulbifer salipaludis TaxID=187980 RepID=A0ABS3E245_9GAMM|nr:hypothetical protein [Microbulbifer salipaludis]MBN8429361.1 hypothetical protein [Microbulbifer salipaludis]
MKRVFSLLAIIVIGVILVSDVGLLIKYAQKPEAYSLMENVSFVHYFILYKNGVEFALLKTIFSGLLMTFWIWRLIYPSRIEALKYATLVYSLLWVSIGGVVLTGISGVLQFSAGLTVKPFDMTPLVVSMNLKNLGVLVAISIALPMVLLFLPRLHNRYHRVSNV